jgi:hypothetical protein
MERYISKSGKSSGVIGYEISEKAISVKFSNNVIYTYTYASAGKDIVEKMKALGIAQLGLSTFIAQNKPNFSSRR